MVLFQFDDTPLLQRSFWCGNAVVINKFLEFYASLLGNVAKIFLVLNGIGGSAASVCFFLNINHFASVRLSCAREVVELFNFLFRKLHVAGYLGIGVPLFRNDEKDVVVDIHLAFGEWVARISGELAFCCSEYGDRVGVSR